QHMQTITATEAAQQDLVNDNAASALRRIRSIEPVLRGLRLRIRGVTLAELRSLQEQTDAFEQRANEQERNLAIMVVIALLISLVFAKLTLRAIEKPLTGLVTAANQFGSGDLNVSINGRMPDEFRVLAGAFT